MSLSTLGGRLLRVGNRLALSLACCCRRFCRQVQDACGNPVYECSNEQAGSVGDCTPECVPPVEPCECGPNTPCGQCFECIDRKCERIEDCCEDGTPCPECQKCEDGACVPCGECEQCVGGACVPCGPCQKCEGGDCVECGADETCVDGVCVPKKYYCCWADCPGGEDSDGNPLPPPQTACIEALYTSEGYESPCGTGEDEYGEECDLTKSGPFVSTQQCQPQCERYACVPDPCGNRECIPDPDGAYASRSECLAACPADPCATPCTFGGASAAGTYSIDACERDICVAYVSPDSRPIRVQIWGPTLDSDCNIIATRVIKADSDWRGEECCDCDSRPDGDLDGGPKGQIKWSKPRGVTSFEVVVLTACGATANIDIQCSDNCGEFADPDMCLCADDDDCNDGCHCCCGKCQLEPCRDNCDEFQNWTLQATFCGETLIWSSDPAQEQTGFRKAFTKPASTGGCCWFGTGDVCSPTFERRTGPGTTLRTTYFICTDGGGNCGASPPELWPDEDCGSPTFGKCFGSIGLLAAGPSGDCDRNFCTRSYAADIVNGELVNIQRGSDGTCGCEESIEVTLSYFPAP
jgi:hypothetical protein